MNIEKNAKIAVNRLKSRMENNFFIIAKDINCRSDVLIAAPSANKRERECQPERLIGIAQIDQSAKVILRTLWKGIIIMVIGRIKTGDTKKNFNLENHD